MDNQIVKVENTGERPITVKFTVAAMIFLGAVFFLPVVFNATSKGFFPFGLLIIVLSSLFFTCGVGIQLGKRWAWWLSLIFNGFLVAVVIFSLITDYKNFNMSYLIILILMYNLLEKNLVEYCGASDVSMKKRIITPLTAVCTGIIILYVRSIL